MIIARIPDVSDLRRLVPKDIWTRSGYASAVEVDPVRRVLPKGLPKDPEWIHTFEVPPHQDPWFRDDLFLTLTVTPDAHRVGDSVARRPVPVPAGTLFVVDPICTHWLLGVPGRTLWVGLQWTIRRRYAEGVARKIITALSGTWVRTRDSRYKDWRQP